MNVRLEKTWVWSSGIVYDDEYKINDYTATVNLLTVSDDSYQQNIAYERVKYWISSIIESAVLIQDGSDLIPAFVSTGQRVLVLPDTPVDQIVGIMLYLKLNSICENRMVITDVKISSLLGDQMTYIHSHGEAIGNLEQDGWWLDPRPTWAQTKGPKKSGKIIPISREQEWADLGLSWEENTERKNTVVFADFVKNEDK